MNEIVEQKDLLDLNVRERAAYRLSSDRKEPFLSPILADSLYSLYESGRTCEEIHGLNKGLSLGSIIRARVDYGWDERRISHFDGIRERAKEQAQNLLFGSLDFLNDLVNAFHKHDRTKFQKFIQSGDPSDLNGALMTNNSNLKTYQAVVELVLKMTGQDSSKTLNLHEHHHTIDAPTSRPLTTKEASEFLAGLPGLPVKK